jgi:hypothetical protein
VVFGVILVSNFKDQKWKIFKTEYSFYWFFTSGLVMIMLATKVYYGTKFLWFSSEPYEKRAALVEYTRLEHEGLNHSGKLNESQSLAKKRMRKNILKN